MAIKIALDCGHGLKTAGKQTPDGIKEWTLNDKVRDKVVGILSDYDCEIIHTDNDEGNTDESLGSRVAKYKAAGAKVFVSIHHNAYTGTWNSATGVGVFTDRNYTAEDQKLAEAIYSRMVEYIGLKGRGIKRANYQVINQNSIPAVLCEGGFMDGKKDYKVITSDEGQTAYAKAVAEGLIEFLGLKKKATPVTPAAPKKEYGVHEVVRGDKLDVLAERFKTTRKVLMELNGIKNPHIIYVGQKIKYPLNAKAETAAPTVSYFKKYTGTSGSIVTALNSIGATSSYSYREKIAKVNGITGYKGTAAQNTKLVSLLKKGKLIKP